jgi:hypothetical protein
MLGLTTRSIWVVVRKLIHDSTIHIEDRGGVQTDKVKKQVAIPFMRLHCRKGRHPSGCGKYKIWKR